MTKLEKMMKLAELAEEVHRYGSLENYLPPGVVEAIKPTYTPKYDTPKPLTLLQMLIEYK